LINKKQKHLGSNEGHKEGQLRSPRPYVFADLTRILLASDKQTFCQPESVGFTFGLAGCLTRGVRRWMQIHYFSYPQLQNFYNFLFSEKEKTCPAYLASLQIKRASFYFSNFPEFLRG
jgi:hypothetical protein